MVCEFLSFKDRGARGTFFDKFLRVKMEKQNMFETTIIMLMEENLAPVIPEILYIVG